MRFGAIDELPIELLIDGDVIAFTAASAAQHTKEDRFGFITEFANKIEGESIVDNMMIGLQQLLNGRKQQVLLSCPAEENFRLDIWPEYKAVRKELRRPLLLPHLRQYLRDNYGAVHWDNLEADDALGILSSEGSTEYKRIICGKDKDFKTVPGFYHRLKDLDARGHPVVNEITPWEAMRFHIFQTLKGDMTDGYPGCPGLGDKRSQELVDTPVLLVRGDGVITRGPRKGEQTDKWTAEPTNDYWAMIVSHYRKAGQGEAEALITARLANILHADQYNKEDGSITLWTPDRITKAM
jgi:DNA polymerase-1